MGAQDLPSVAGNSSSGDFTVTSDNFKDSRPLNIFLQAYVENAFYNLYAGGASFYWPDRMYITTDLDWNSEGSVNLSAMYFLSSWEHEGSRKFLFRTNYSNGTATQYKLTYTLPIKHHIGPHAGITYPIISNKYPSSYQDPLNCITIIMGTGYIRGRHLDITITKGSTPLKAIKTKQVGFFVDFAYFMYGDPKPNSDMANWGLKLYMRGKNSFRGRYDWGYNYALGMGTYGADVVYPQWGLGLYVGIG